MQQEADLKSDVKIFGFWVYLMTDLVIFAALFATYIVLRNGTFGKPSGKELFEMSVALQETLILLISSFTCALAMLEIHRKQKTMAIFWFILTGILGLAFLTIEILEFAKFINLGYGPNQSAFLSSFFTLVGTHGLHITFGLLWMAVEIFRIWLKPLSGHNISRIFRMALFWHFLDFVWIFIFTTVYGMGHLI
jgi:cytochrome o ubiquinol oxidase subunit III